LQRLQPGRLGDADAVLLRRVGQSPGQPGRVDHRGFVGVEAPGQVRRRVDQLADRLRIEEPRSRRLQPRDLVRSRGHRQLPATRPPALDAVRVQRLLDLVEVLQPELLQDVVLLGPSRPAVRLAVGQARLAEASVASRGVLGDPVRLDEQDPAAGAGVPRPAARPTAR
jgi:hypothetical protein